MSRKECAEHEFQDNGSGLIGVLKGFMLRNFELGTIFYVGWEAGHFWNDSLVFVQMENNH